MAGNEHSSLNGGLPGELRLLLKKNDGMALKILIGVLAVGIALLLWPRPYQPDSLPQTRLVDSAADQTAVTPTPTDEEAAMERRLESLLSVVAGAGAVSVDILLKSHSEIQFGTNSRSERRVTQERSNDGGNREVDEETVSRELVMERDSRGKEAPVSVGRTGPVVASAVIVAEGAVDPRVRLALARAASSLLNISLHRVTVLPRERGK